MYSGTKILILTFVKNETYILIAEKMVILLVTINEWLLGTIRFQNMWPT